MRRLLAQLGVAGWMLSAATLLVGREARGQGNAGDSYRLNWYAVSRGAPAHILFIDIADPLRPLAQLRQQAFVARLRDRLNRRVQIHLENIERVRFPGPDNLMRAVGWYAERYRDTPLDVIASEGREGLSAAVQLRERLGRRMSIVVLLLPEEMGKLDVDSLRVQGISLLLVGDVVPAAVRHAQALFPDVRRAVVVTDDSLQGALLAQTVDEASAGRLAARTLVRLRMPEYRDSLSALARDELVFYWSLSLDGDGSPWIPAEALAAMAGASARPIIGVADNLVGLGVTGGPALSPEAIGQDIADRVIRLLDAGPGSSVPPLIYDRWSWRYDWRELQRHGADLSVIPTEATFINRPLAFWAAYPVQTAIAAVLLAIQMALIILLGRRGAYLRATSNELRQMSERLLRVQDHERARIARDLHDDLCQDLSLMAIEVARTGHPEASQMSQRVRATVKRAQAIARGLHPTYGLAAALPEVLKGHAESIQQLHGLKVWIYVDETFGSVDPELTIPFYRIVQEALSNVVRHAKATCCEVQISGNTDEVYVRVRDNGVGFAVDPRQLSGLGLLSMRERARGIGGRLHVSSAPGNGAEVVVTVPRMYANRHDDT